MGRISTDDKLDKEIDEIIKRWKNDVGLNLSRPAALRLLVKAYKDNPQSLKRKPRSKEWNFL